MKIEQSRPQACLPSGSVLRFSVLHVETTHTRIVWGCLFYLYSWATPDLSWAGVSGVVGQESLTVNKSIVKAEQHQFKKLHHFFCFIIKGIRRIQSRSVLKL